MNKKLFLFTGFCITFLFSAAQNIGIGTTNPLALLHVTDSNVLFTGPNPFVNYAPAAHPPVQGSGTRMMWYAQKAAFRAGWVEDNRWDKDSIGIFSIALGHSPLASNTSAVSVGFRTRSTGFASTALGSVTEALADGATSMGYLTKALAFYSTSMGYNTISGGFASTSMGSFTKAIGTASASMGSFTKARSDNSLAIGQFNDTSATNRLFEIGNGTTDNNRNNAVTVLKDGNTGIGVLNPLEKLEVAGKIKSTALQVTSGAAPGSVLTSDASGNASWQPASNANTGLEASTFAGQVISSGVFTKVIFNFKYTDPASAFSTVNSEWTIPATGFYHISAALFFFTLLPPGTDVVLSLRVNGSEIKQKKAKIADQSTIDLSADIALAANDLVTVYVLQLSGAAATLTNGRSGIYLSGFKVY